MTTPTIIAASRILEKHPCMSLAAVGRLVGVSRERLRQLKDKGLIPEPKSKRRIYYCVQCGGECPVGRRVYCSDVCYFDYHHALVVCDYCGKTSYRNYMELVRGIKATGQNHIFCNKQCHGHWLTNNHGFRVHPENRIKAGQTRHRNLQPRNDAIRQCAREHPDWPYQKLAEAFGLSLASIYRIVSVAKQDEEGK